MTEPVGPRRYLSTELIPTIPQLPLPSHGTIVGSSGAIVGKPGVIVGRLWGLWAPRFCGLRGEVVGEARPIRSSFSPIQGYSCNLIFFLESGREVYIEG